jgi:replicative DNA helicase
MSEIAPSQLPPHNRDAERGVLGGILRDPDVLPEVQQLMVADQFYFDAHQKIYQALSDLSNEAQPIDLVLLHDKLRKNKQLEDVGGVMYLTELWEAVPTGANAQYHAKLVRDTAMVRGLIHASNEILRDSYERTQSADELVSQAERKIMEIAKSGMVGETQTLAEVVNAAFTRLDSRIGKENLSISGLASGYVDLDNITAGLQNSELVIIAARPSVGKTAFALNMVRNIVTESDPHGNMPVVLFFSLEMARIELAERLLCCQSRVDSHKVRKGHLSSDDIDKLMAAGDVLKRARLYIDDTPSRTMIQIAASARRLMKKHERDGGLKLIVIDYLQLIEPENRRDPRQEQVAQISRRLKFLARELLIPVIALAQVNRASEDRQDHKPRLSDLRESGCLTGDTLVTLADTGARVPIRDLMGRSGCRVWALDESTLKLKPAEVSRAFPTGRKPVYRLTTRLGRTIRATANHAFRAFGGWKRLDELVAGERVAVPRALPEGTAARETHLLQPEGLAQLSRGQRPRYFATTEQPEGLRQTETFAPARTPWGFTAPTLALRALADSDVYWDEVVSIVPDGEEEVYDLTVPGPHNFVADGFVVHNSIEQDADTCMMLHRPGKFDGAQADNILEIIIAKQRNGPTGEITLTWMKEYNRYENYIADVGMGEGV